MTPENVAGPALEKIERGPTMKVRAYAAIRSSVVRGLIAPGSQLVEAKLAAELGISRGPVREALALLHEEGLLQTSPTRGLVVRQFTPDDLIDSANFRIGLETVAIRLAIRRNAGTTRLRELIEDMTTAAARGDVATISGRELDFHQVLCDLSGNAYLSASFRSLSAQLEMINVFENYQYADPMTIGPEHWPIVAALEAHDEEAATQVVIWHIVDSVFEHWAKRIGRQELRDRLLLPARPREDLPPLE